MHQLTVHSQTDAKQHQVSAQPEARAKQHHDRAQPHQFSAQQCAQSKTFQQPVSTAQLHNSWAYMHARPGRKRVPLCQGVGLIKLCIPDDSFTPHRCGNKMPAVTTAGSAAAVAATYIRIASPDLM
ncbi:TPA: hypothetical protein ACH3X3_010485 [Trebouxia sp. C0006]